MNERAMPMHLMLLKKMFAFCFAHFDFLKRM